MSVKYTEKQIIKSYVGMKLSLLISELLEDKTTVSDWLETYETLSSDEDKFSFIHNCILPLQYGAMIHTYDKITEKLSADELSQGIIESAQEFDDFLDTYNKTVADWRKENPSK